MAKPEVLEILISADGERMLITAHNFKGRGCEAAVKAFSSGGEILQSGPTAEYYQREDQEKHTTQRQ
jgi:hypothetical protein